jgi:PHD/YefM family antitoxin component YafN of YafNO toxin-antitoxin module
MNKAIAQETKILSSLLILLRNYPSPINRLQTGLRELPMLTRLPSIQDLRQMNASLVKNNWAELVHLVHQSGCVAITRHSAVEVVLLDPAKYRQLAEEIRSLRVRERGTLERAD